MPQNIPEFCDNNFASFKRILECNLGLMVAIGLVTEVMVCGVKHCAKKISQWANRCGIPKCASKCAAKVPTVPYIAKKITQLPSIEGKIFTVLTAARWAQGATVPDAIVQSYILSRGVSLIQMGIMEGASAIVHAREAQERSTHRRCSTPP
jgi:hypothetical protein